MDRQQRSRILVAPLFIDDRIIFIHNPRAAGTSIRRALLRGLNPNEHIPWPGNLPSTTSRNQKHAFASMTRQRMGEAEWNKRFKFAVVRNPYDRLVSFYGLFRKTHVGGNMHLAKDKHKFQKFFAAFDNTDFNRMMASGDKRLQRKAYSAALSFSFKDWLRFCLKRNWNNCRYLGNSPMLMIPQAAWFDGLDVVFRFEDMGVIRDFLLGHGYDEPIPENQTHHGSWRKYYDDETSAWVAETFKADIERYYANEV